MWCVSSPNSNSGKNKDRFPWTEDSQSGWVGFLEAVGGRLAGGCVAVWLCSCVGKAGFWMAPPTVQQPCHVPVNKMRTISHQHFNTHLQFYALSIYPAHCHPLEQCFEFEILKKTPLLFNVMSLLTKCVLSRTLFICDMYIVYLSCIVILFEEFFKS